MHKTGAKLKEVTSKESLGEEDEDMVKARGDESD